MSSLQQSYIVVSLVLEGHINVALQRNGDIPVCYDTESCYTYHSAEHTHRDISFKDRIIHVHISIFLSRHFYELHIVEIYNKLYQHEVRFYLS
jgi:hypothetical protein